MKLVHFVAVFVALALVPLVARSEAALGFWILALLFALLGQSWNILGGYGGQFSFGHALFFGIGGYVSALLQIKAGFNAWPALLAATAAGASIGAFTGALSFRYNLRGSYFALITLAFAEVARILAGAFTFTGAGAGLYVPLAPGAQNFQFSERLGFYYVALLFLLLATATALWLERSRFGAYLIAVRENEAAAQALGVRTFRVKLLAITLSGAFAALAGVFYVQFFLFIDPWIGFGPAFSVEALLVAIVGGMGTVLGPIIGALALHAVGDLAKHLTGGAPGLNLVVYGLVLVLVLRFLPDGLMGLFQRLWRRFSGRGVPAKEVRHA